MKKNLFIIVSILSITYAKPAFMGGFTYKFGTNNSLENLGTTIKVLSSGEDKKAVVSIGASYYPWSKNNQFGLDAAVGYNLKKVNLGAGWDFINNEPSVSLGYASSIKDDTNKEVIDEETIKNCKNK